MSKELTPQQALKHNLMKMKDTFKDALPSHIKPEKFVNVLMTAVNLNPSLANADRGSLFNACMKAAQDGLIPDGKEAALVTFKNQVNYMPMIAGILKKVRNSGELATIVANIIHKNDPFEYYVDSDGEHLKHSPEIFGDRGEVVGVYALAKTRTGDVYVEVMNMTEINAVKKASRSGNSGPWGGEFATEMMKKTALRRLAKRLPMSSDVEIVIQRDDELYEFEKPAPVAEDNREETAASNKGTDAPNNLKSLINESESPL